MNELEKLPRIAYPPELKILTESARKRLIAAAKAQDYYDGNFWRWIDSEVFDWNQVANIPERNTGKDYHNRKKRVNELDYVPTKLELHYPRFLIDELASWMFENPIGLETPNEDYYKQLEAIHSGSKLDQKLLQSGGEGCLTGGVAAKVLYSERIEQTRILIRPSRECFPIMDRDDSDIMEKVHFCAIMDDEKTVWKQTFEIVEYGGGKVCWVTEALYDLDKIGEREAKPKQILCDDPLYKGSTPIDFIPVTLIPNEPLLGQIFGESDLVPLYTPINEICRKFSDAADALKFELFPIKLIMNIEESNTDEFKIRPGAAWLLQGGDENHPADARNLESSMSNMEHLYNFVDGLLDALHQFSGVPRITREKIDATGPIAGVALKLMFTSIVSKCNRKMKYWLPALEQVYDHALRTSSVYEGFAYDPDKLDLTVKATPRIPQNELEQLEIEAKRIEMLVKSIVTVMKEMGIQNPEEELAKILAERQQIEAALTPDLAYSRIKGEAEVAGTESE